MCVYSQQSTGDARLGSQSDLHVSAGLIVCRAVGAPVIPAEWREEYAAALAPGVQPARGAWLCNGAFSRSWRWPSRCVLVADADPAPTPRTLTCSTHLPPLCRAAWGDPGGSQALQHPDQPQGHGLHGAPAGARALCTQTTPLARLAVHALCHPYVVNTRVRHFSAKRFQKHWLHRLT